MLFATDPHGHAILEIVDGKVYLTTAGGIMIFVFWTFLICFIAFIGSRK